MPYVNLSSLGSLSCVSVSREIIASQNVTGLDGNGSESVDLQPQPLTLSGNSVGQPADSATLAVAVSCSV